MRELTFVEVSTIGANLMAIMSVPPTPDELENTRKAEAALRLMRLLNKKLNGKALKPQEAKEVKTISAYLEPEARRLGLRKLTERRA